MSRTLSEREHEKLVGEIAGLQTLALKQLRARWRTLYASEAPARFSRHLLMGAVAYRLAGAGAGRAKSTTRRLFQRVAASARARQPLMVIPVRRLEPGALLVREWNGVKRKVVMVEGGFSYRSQRYRSLSAVARHITGSHCRTSIRSTPSAKPARRSFAVRR